MDIKVGKVTHFFNRISVAVIDFSGDLQVGDKISILGRTTDLAQFVTSLEIDHHKVQAVHAGMEAALLVADPVREGDTVYKAVESE